MNRKRLKGWMKHGDFIVLDMLCLQVCFMLAYWILHGWGNPYGSELFAFQALLLLMSQLVVILFSNGYSGVLRRKRFDEAMAVLKHTVGILLVAVVFLFVTHRSSVASRLLFGFTLLFFLILAFFVRQLNKRRIYRFSRNGRRKRSVYLITSRKLVNEAMSRLNEDDTYQNFFISGIILMDAEETENEYLWDYGVPVRPLTEEAVEELGHGWVDEVFILQPDDMLFSSRLMNALMQMGITVNYSMSALNDARWPIMDMRKLGGYKVLANSVKFVSSGQMAVKRALDILGGLVGCLITGLLCIFIAPAIYVKSPGPIFFKQERVGRNGKVFKMYKFRSMYLDAEERKTELMAQNKVRDGMMFKMDDDPRIIGSEKKGKDGKPKGIGNFIRNTSLDEFPQFINILFGQMSLVGWRPCTLNEWERYNLQHRIRASMKPGLTGMWQVSGRSEITDFEEVVRLDREYMENWGLALDLKILLKTVWVVLTRHGAE